MDEDDKRVAGLYARLVRTHGINHRSLDWTSEDAQTARFKRLSLIGFENGHSVLDVGCGLGDLLAWLRQNDLSRMIYFGLDMTSAMIDRCRTRFPGIAFTRGNILDHPLPLTQSSFDWVAASGIFAHRRNDPDGYMKTVITRMAGLARRGIVFNSLSACAADPGGWTLYHADPQVIRTYCDTFGWTTMVTQTPDRSDFTVYMWRPETDPFPCGGHACQGGKTVH